MASLSLDFKAFESGVDRSSQDALRFGKLVQDTMDRVAGSAKTATSAIGSTQGPLNNFSNWLATASANGADLAKVTTSLGANVQSVRQITGVMESAAASVHTMSTALDKVGTSLGAAKVSATSAANGVESLTASAHVASSALDKVGTSLGAAGVSTSAAAKGLESITASANGASSALDKVGTSLGATGSEVKAAAKGLDSFSAAAHGTASALDDIIARGKYAVAQMQLVSAQQQSTTSSRFSAASATTSLGASGFMSAADLDRVGTSLGALETKAEKTVEVIRDLTKATTSLGATAQSVQQVSGSLDNVGTSLGAAAGGATSAARGLDSFSSSGHVATAVLDDIIARGKSAVLQLQQVAAQRNSLSGKTDLSTAGTSLGASGFHSLADLEKAGTSLGAAATQSQKATQGLQAVGTQSKLTGNQIAQLSAQFQDLFVQIQAGGSPLTALIQQGSGLASGFGGLKPALQAVGSLFTVARVAAGGAAAAFLAVVLAAKQGRDEFNELNKSLVLSGNFAGKTAGQLQDLAAAQSRIAGTQGKAAESIGQMAASGQVAGNVIGKLAQSSIAFERAGGGAAEEVNKKFIALGKDPLAGLIKLNESENFLTKSLYDQVKALQDQGRLNEAAIVAQKGYAAAVDQTAAQLESKLGTFEKAWRSLGDAAKWAWDRMLNIGRPETVADAIATAEAGVTAARKRLEGNGRRGGTTAELRGSNAQEDLAAAQALADTRREGARLEERVADMKGVQATRAKAIVDTEKAVEASLSSQARLNKEIESTRTRMELAGRSPEEIKAALTAIEQGSAAFAQSVETAMAKIDGERSASLDTTKAKEMDLRRQVDAGLMSQFALEREMAKLRVADVNTQLDALDKQRAQIARQREPIAALTRNENERNALIRERARLLEDETKRVADLVKKYEGRNASPTELFRISERQGDQAISDSQQQRRVDYTSSIQDQARALKDSNEELAAEFRLIGSTSSARDTTLTQLRAEQQLRKQIQEIEAAYPIVPRAGTPEAEFDQERQRLVRARQDAVNAARANSAEAVAQQASKAYIAEFQRNNDTIRDGLADAVNEGIVNGGESASKILKNMFNQMVLTPILRVFVQPVSGALAALLTGGSAAYDQASGTSAGGLVSGASTLSNAYSAYTGGSNLLGSVGSYGYTASGAAYGTSAGSQQSLMLAQQEAGMGATNVGGSYLSGIGTYAAYAGLGQIAGRGISGGYSALGGNSGSTAVNVGTVVGTAIGAYFGAPEVGAAIGGAIGGVINRAFGHKAPEIVAKGIEGSFKAGDFTGQEFNDILEKGGWFTSDKNYTQYKELSADVNKALDEGATQILTGVQKYTDVLGLPAEKLNTVMEKFRVEITDNADLNNQAVGEVLQKYANTLVSAFTDELEPLRKAGETAAQTIERVGGALTTVNSVLSQLGLQQFDKSVAGAKDAVSLSDRFGGAGGFQQASAQFYQSFYSEAQQVQDLTKTLGDSFSKLGLTMPSVADGVESAHAAYVALVQAEKLDTEASRERFAALLALSPVFDALAQATDKVTKAAEEAAKKEQDRLKTISEKSAGLDVQLLRATGQEMAAVAKEREIELAQLRQLEITTNAAAGAFTNVQQAIYAAVDAAKQAERFKSLAGSVDSVVGGFLKGPALSNYFADRILQTLGEVGITGTQAGVLASTKQDILDLWNAVGIDGKEAILKALPMWEQLQDQMLKTAGTANSVADLLAAVNEFSPPTETLVDKWREAKTLQQTLQDAWNDIWDIPSNTPLDKAQALHAKYTGLLGVIDSNLGARDNAIIGRGDQSSVDFLKRRESTLSAEYFASNDPKIAQAWSESVIKRIQIEGQLKEKALQDQYQAEYDAAMETYNIAKQTDTLLNEQQRKQRDSIQAQIDGLTKMKELAKQLPDILDGFRAGNLSNLSYTGRLSAQRSLFERSLETGNDPQGQLNAYLQQAQQVYGGATTQYSNIFNQALAEFEAKVKQGAIDADAMLPNAVRQLNGINKIADAAMPELKKAVVDTSNDIVSAVTGLNTTFNTGLDKVVTEIGTWLATTNGQVTDFQTLLTTLADPYQAPITGGNSGAGGDEGYGGYGGDSGGGGGAAAEMGGDLQALNENLSASLNELRAEAAKQTALLLKMIDQKVKSDGDRAELVGAVGLAVTRLQAPAEATAANTGKLVTAADDEAAKPAVMRDW